MKLKKKIEFVNFFFFFLKKKKSTADTHILTLTKKRLVKLLFKTFTNN